MTTITAERAAHLSILYAEDFDVPDPELPSLEGSGLEDPSPPESEREGPLGPDPADAVESARKDGFDAGWLAASQAALASREAAIETMVGGLLAGVEGAYASLDKAVDAWSAEVVGLVVGVLSAALPNLIASQGQHEIEGALEALVREIDPCYRLEVEVHPTTQALLAPRLASSEGRLTWRSNTSMPASDLRVGWYRGSFVRDSADVLARLLTGLAECSAHCEAKSGDRS